MTPDLDITAELIKFKKNSDKSVIACFLGQESFKESVKLLEANGIPVFYKLERVAKLLSNL